jgi:hypothetical protein
VLDGIRDCESVVISSLHVFSRKQVGDPCFARGNLHIGYELKSVEYIMELNPGISRLSTVIEVYGGKSCNTLIIPKKATAKAGSLEGGKRISTARDFSRVFKRSGC